MTSQRALPTSRAVLALLLLAGVALADGLSEARRSLGFAKDQVDRDQNLEQAIDYCGRAEKSLASVPDGGEKTALLAEIRQTLDKATKMKLAREIKNMDGMIQREYVQLEEACKGQGNRGSGLDEVDEIEPLFARIENLLKMDSVVKVFDEAHMAEWRAKIDALHGLAMRTVYDTCAKQAEERIIDLEKENAGTGNLGSSAEERWGEYAQKEIDKLADTDKRKETLQARLEAAKRARARRVSGNAREEAITAARAYWALQQKNHEHSAARWKTENAYEFNTWWREHGRLNLDKTEDHFDQAARMMEDDRWKTIVKDHADDQRVKDLMAEVHGVAAEASKKIGLAADKLMAQAEGKIAESGATEVKNRAESMLRVLMKVGDASPEGKAALERCRALVNRCHEVELNGTDPGPSATPPATTQAPPTAASSAASETPEGTPAVAEAPSGGGGLGALGWLLSCGCCFLLVAAAGGGAFFVLKGKGAAAAPPAAA